MTKLTQLTVLLLSFVTFRTEATTLYQQTFADDNSYTSQNDTQSGGLGSFSKVFDNFTLTSSSQISDVHWIGAYYPEAGSTDIGSPVVSGFLIEFWSDALGEPGSLLFSESISGNADETFLNAGLYNQIFYSYDADLTSNFLALAGTQYWLSIQAQLAYPPHWGWATGNGPDSASYQDYLDQRYFNENDQAFSLTGTSVPEPSTILLLGIASCGLLLRKRKLV